MIRALLLALPLFVAAGPPARPAPPADDSASRAAADVNAFGIELYKELTAEGDENMFLSPINIAAALHMAREGAIGETAAQMEKVLQPGQGGAPFTGLLTATQPGKEAPFELTMAQAVWLQQGYPVLPAYVQKVEKDYDAVARNLDFVTQPDAARETINAWVEKQTKDRIQDLIPEGGIDGQTRMVITTAIYFLGTWADTFDKDATTDQPFTLASGEKVDHPLMADFEKRAGYLDGDGFALLKLPYKGGDLAMVVLLPDEADGLGAMEKGLTAEKFAQWCKAAKVQEVRVWLPRFEMTVPSNLNQPLKAMGITAAFDPNAADFGGLADSAEQLYISDVVHKAFVKVDEQGTEAAAATGIMVRATAMPMEEPPTFRADHPFAFAIVHEETGAILFLGRVMDPR